VKQRRRDDGRLASAHRHPLQHRADSDEPPRILTRRALRRARRAAGEDHDPTGAGWRRRQCGGALGDQEIELVGVGIVDCDRELPKRRLHVADRISELGVVDEQIDALALGDLGALSRREGSG
jgi:hypothetical protein